MRVPNLEGLVQEAEDQAAGNTALVRAFDCIARAIIDLPRSYYIYPLTVQGLAEIEGRASSVDVMPGLKAVMAAYPHGDGDPSGYKIDKLRMTLARLKLTSEDTK